VNPNLAIPNWGTNQLLVVGIPHFQTSQGASLYGTPTNPMAMTMMDDDGYIYIIIYCIHGYIRALFGHQLTNLIIIPSPIHGINLATPSRLIDN